MKVSKRWIPLVALVLLVSLMMALPVSAAKPKKSDCGLLLISTSGEDIQLCMAVCIAEEDGDYVYSGSRPIQQQIALYSSATNSLEYNSAYDVEEDTDYDGVQGVYRFKLGEKLESGSEADVFPGTAAVSKGDTVYFVHLDVDVSDVFIMERTTVESVYGGELTTKDGLEKESEEGEFSVIFNDSGDVVGFCKSGLASVPYSSDSINWYYIGGLVLGFLLGLLILWRRKVRQKKEAERIRQHEEDAYIPWDDDRTKLDTDTLVEAIGMPSDRVLVLKCHGGYLNGRSYAIPPTGISIGRDMDNTIVYPGQTPGISRHHAKLFWQNGQLMLMDMGSSNGTYLNASGRMAQMNPEILKTGDVFYLGEKLNGFEIAQKQ